MNIAMAKLNLSLLDGEQEQDENKEFFDVIDGEDASTSFPMMKEVRNSSRRT
jgi:hypothetical protein